MQQNKKTAPVKKDKVHEQIQQLRTDLAVCNDKYLRALADYRNLDNRLTQEKMRALLDIQKRTITTFLSLKDDIDNASLFEENEGLKLVKKKFEDIFRTFGVEKMETDGMEFSADTMECIQTEPGEKNNIVLQTHEQGYMLNGELLRVAKVTVSVATETKNNTN
ncbi:nucleotide exchange factor GrpE [Candidatus Roizmanbacteria bacterium CG10_big_fil_rev_8_21_14_0_10_39_6]|uniref:Protein GrpE n=1 Tax=Candidatus Roizmanbacteria bacterium CG10_big_fil_rev_8_21_14_0_10_39_6 TaxID=1974853 RepID=A0A2M8KRE6_9BACT|nr:MAG: nucleotide exchange factor GrpE [Candidatus Roizmanbacteria bacterium CG10_big_fil_rev_8_21_14_0_10_39_6]